MKKRFVLVLGLILGGVINAQGEERLIIFNYGGGCDMPLDQQVRFEKELEYYTNDNETFNKVKRTYEKSKSWWRRLNISYSDTNEEIAKNAFICKLKYDSYDAILSIYGYGRRSDNIDTEMGLMEKLDEMYKFKYGKYANEEYLKNISK